MAVDKEKVKNIYTKGLVSLEVIKLKEMPASVEEAEGLYEEIVKHKTYLIDDLSDPYIVRLAYTENKSKLRSVDPDRLDDIDAFELGESIQEILKENGFPVIKSDFPEAPEGYLEERAEAEGDSNGEN
jgi:hypothetical protein